MDKVTVHLSAEQNLYHASKMLTGLAALSRARELHLSAVPCDRCLSDSLTLILDARRDHKVARIAIDLHDRSDVFAQEALTHCDVYLKRGYYQPDVERLESAVRGRVRPFGLNYGCMGRGVARHVVAAIGLQFASIAAKTMLRSWRGGDAGIGVLKQYLSLLLPAPKEYEAEPEATARPVDTLSDPRMGA